MIQQEYTRFVDPYHLEAASIRSENVVTSRKEDSSLSDFGPSIQVLEPTALVEVADQVYKTVLLKEVCQSPALQSPCLVEVNDQVTKDDGLLETFQSLLQVYQVLDR